MLETKIETLTKAIADLNGNIEKLNANFENLFANKTTAPAKDISENAYAKAKAKVAEPDPVEETMTPEQSKADHAEQMANLDEWDALADKPAKKTRAKKAEPVEAPAEETVSIDDLQRFCLAIVREKRHLRDKIKEVVFEVTGAKFMPDVPPEKAGELKAAIEALVAEG